MQEILSINVKYTLKDLKAFSFAKARSGFRMVGFIFCIILTIFFAYGIVLAVLTIPSVVVIFMSLTSMVVPALLIWGFYLLPAFLTYSQLRTSFIKSRLLGLLQCYRFFDDRLEICSENGNFSLLWNDIYKVQELKPCFIIQSSPGKMSLIPRRCFESQEQLDLFIDIMKSRMENNKIKLKGYRLKNSNPDYGEIKYYENIDKAAGLEIEQGEPILEVQFSLLKNDYLDFNFRLYYTKPTGLILTAIGILLLAATIRNFILSIGNPILSLVLGIVFTFALPLKLYYSSVKCYERDAALQKPYIIRFYSEYFVVEHPSGTNKIKFCDLVKVTEFKSAILLFVTTQIAHIVPKRVFEGREDKLIAIRDLLRQRVWMK